MATGTTSVLPELHDFKLSHYRNCGSGLNSTAHYGVAVHFTDLTESGVKRTAWHPDSLEHIRIPRRTRRAELCSGKATWKLACDSAV